MKPAAILVSLVVWVVRAHADYFYVANYGNNTIEKFDANGHSSVFASSGLSSPIGLAFDSSGKLYVGNWGSSTIMKYDASGTETVFADLGGNRPMALAFDSNGNLYVANRNGNSILKIDASGHTSFFASASQPVGLAFDGSGNLFASCQGNNTIVKYDPNGLGSVFASLRAAGPTGLAFDPSGNLYVAIYSSHAIMKYDAAGHGAIFANTGPGYSNPLGLAFDASGNLYVACAGNFLEKFTANGNRNIFATTRNGPWFIARQLSPNSPPMVSCPAGVTLECGKSAEVIAGVSDADGDGLALVWAVNGQAVRTNTVPASDPPLATNVSFSAELPLGTNTITVTAIDTETNTASCSTMVTVVDSTPPLIASASAYPDVLWPPNHKLVVVRLYARVDDDCSPATWKIIGVRSNEQRNGKGDSDTAPDSIIIGDHTVKLRSELAGNGRGRSYLITIQAKDTSGNLSRTRIVTVTVPKSQGHR